ncbi:MAG: hypothetical protein Q8R60_15590 [Mycobacteriales bacterium]|nr:hypothetical protein [Mycobacteriales bacterium]
MTDAAVPYVRDLGDLLWTLADEARRTAGDDSYKRGRAFGLYEAVSLLEQQAVAFGLPPAAVGMAERRAESLLTNQE